VTSEGSLADRVHDRLLAELLEGTWAANDSLYIPQIAAQFGVSQTPVREALARLEHTGLVHRQAHRGYRIAPLLTDEEIALLYDSRLVIEPELVYLATRRRTPEFLAELGGLVAALASVAGKADSASFRVYWTTDDRYHVAIAEQAGNPFLLSAYRSLGTRIQRFRLVARRGLITTRNVSTSAATEHREILQAIEAGDPVVAADLMTSHITRARVRLIGDDPDWVRPLRASRHGARQATVE